MFCLEERIIFHIYTGRKLRIQFLHVMFIQGKAVASAVINKNTVSQSTKKLIKKDCCPEAVLTTTDDKQTEVIQGKFQFLQSIFFLDLKICKKFTGEYPSRNVILTKLQKNFTVITLRHGCSPVNLLHIFRTAFP